MVHTVIHNYSWVNVITYFYLNNGGEIVQPMAFVAALSFSWH